MWGHRVLPYHFGSQMVRSRWRALAFRRVVGPIVYINLRGTTSGNGPKQGSRERSFTEQFTLDVRALKIYYGSLSSGVSVCQHTTICAQKCLESFKCVSLIAAVIVYSLGVFGAWGYHESHVTKSWPICERSRWVVGDVNRVLLHILPAYTVPPTLHISLLFSQAVFRFLRSAFIPGRGKHTHKPKWRRTFLPS